MPRVKCKNEVFIGGPWRVQGGPLHLGGPKAKPMEMEPKETWHEGLYVSDVP